MSALGVDEPFDNAKLLRDRRRAARERHREIAGHVERIGDGEQQRPAARAIADRRDRRCSDRARRRRGDRLRGDVHLRRRDEERPMLPVTEIERDVSSATGSPSGELIVADTSMPLAPVIVPLSGILRTSESPGGKRRRRAVDRIAANHRRAIHHPNHARSRAPTHSAESDRS